MYDFPEIRAATDALWEALAAAIRARGLGAPSRLTRPNGPLVDHWSDPRLLLSQTCGWPYATALAGRVRLLASPVYEAEGCAGPTYRSAVVVRRDDPAQALDDLRGRRLAMNGSDSLSGCHALRMALAPLASQGRFFGTVLTTGTHRASAAAVASGRADACALDCVTWRLIGRVDPALAGALRAIGWTDPAPSLPFIAAAAAPDATAALLTEALVETCGAPGTLPARRVLGLLGAVPADEGAYAAVAARAAAADALGYPALA